MTYCFFEDLFKLDPVQLMLLLDIHEFIRDFVNLSIPRNSKILSTTLVKSWCCSWKLALILAVNLLKFHSSTSTSLWNEDRTLWQCEYLQSISSKLKGPEGNNYLTSIKSISTYGRVKKNKKKLWEIPYPTRGGQGGSFSNFQFFWLKMS